MAKSLQDQLLKAGLVDKKKSKQIKQEKRKHAKQVKHGLAEADDVAERVKKAREEEAERNRQLNKEKQAEAEKKALKAQVLQLIEQHSIPLPQDGVTYQFADGKLVKRVIVTEAQQDQLSRGILAIARYNEGYSVVPFKTAEKISERWEDAIVLLNQKDQGDEGDEVDPYADYQIPDDLMW